MVCHLFSAKPLVNFSFTITFRIIGNYINIVDIKNQQHALCAAKFNSL